MHSYITETLKIDLPKSFIKKKGSEIVQWNRIPSFQGSADDHILTHFVDMLERVADLNDRADKKHFEMAIDSLDKLITWRNAVYKRIGTPFPTQDQLKEKHRSVSKAAKDLHEAFAFHWQLSTPYTHAILHNQAYLLCDVVDRHR